MFHTGDVIRKWRTAKGWKNEKLAEHAKVDKNTVTRAERGEPTGTDTLERIVTALGHTMKELHSAVAPVDVDENEAKLLADYRLCDPYDQAFLRDSADRLRRRPQERHQERAPAEAAR